MDGFLDRPFVGEQWLAGNGSQLANINPATEEAIVNVDAADTEMVRHAVRMAKSALPDWERRPGKNRTEYLLKMAEIFERDAGELVPKSSLINGKPLAEARVDLDDVVATLRYYADQAASLDERQEQLVPLRADGGSSYVRHEAAGVVVLVTPWNFPLVTSAWKIAPALAAGCSVLLKPAEAVSSVELEWGRVALEADLPDGC